MSLHAAEVSNGLELFRERGYLVVPRLIDAALAEFLYSYICTRFACRLLIPGDPLVPNTPNDYGDPAFEGLLEYLRPKIQDQTGLELFPTYSYFRLYKRGDVLKPHHDRPACEISISLNLGQVPAEPWPLHVEGHTGPCAALLQPGDALVYQGRACRHWRDAYTGQQLAQAFLHYVDRNGPHADQKFDGRPSLMLGLAAKKSARAKAAVEI